MAVHDNYCFIRSSARYDDCGGRAPLRLAEGHTARLPYLWRAVDYEGEVLESVVTATRNKTAALKFIKKATNRHGRPRAIVTDGLRS